MIDLSLSPLTLQQIQIFMTVVEMQGFSKAGIVLHMTQSAVSKSIAKMEKDIGVVLFVRTTRTFELTEEGGMLFGMWRQHMEETSAAFQKIRDMQNAKKHKLNIAAASTTNVSKYLFPYMEKFSECYPMVELMIDSDTMNTLAERLLNGEYDIIFIPDFEHYTLDVNHFPWKWAAKDLVQVLVPNANPLSSRESLELEDLLDEPIGTLADDVTPNYYHYLKDLFEPFGKMPAICRKYKSAYTIKNMYRPQDGLLLVDSYFDYNGYLDITRIPLKDCENGIICSWNPNTKNEYISKFVELIPDMQ